MCSAIVVLKQTVGLPSPFGRRSAVLFAATHREPEDGRLLTGGTDSSEDPGSFSQDKVIGSCTLCGGSSSAVHCVREVDSACFAGGHISDRRGQRMKVGQRMELDLEARLKRAARAPSLQRMREACLFPREVIRDRRRITAGSPVPPDRVKHKLIELAAVAAGARVVVETGTYWGDTTAYFAVRGYQVHSIELSPRLTALAEKRFKRLSNVHLYQGDSGEILSEVIGGIGEPICFWLDGHYSGGVTAGVGADVPILREIEVVGQHPVRAQHVIVVDDMNSFDGGEYPTVAEVVRGARRVGFDESHLESNLLFLRSRPGHPHEWGRED